EIKQTVVLDLEMAGDVRKAAARERIEDALNYKAVAKRMIQFVGESRFQLVETLAERCAEIILSEFDVPWVRLSVNKIGAVSGARDVGVLIERGTKD
ncbi:MAG: FolB domain-containing protein, partial [bacterium]|nr:FolB domain-containing protein [bacterium]